MGTPRISLFAEERAGTYHDAGRHGLHLVLDQVHRRRKELLINHGPRDVQQPIEPFGAFERRRRLFRAGLLDGWMEQRGAALLGDVPREVLRGVEECAAEEVAEQDCDGRRQRGHVSEKWEEFQFRGRLTGRDDTQGGPQGPRDDERIEAHEGDQPAPRVGKSLCKASRVSQRFNSGKRKRMSRNCAHLVPNLAGILLVDLFLPVERRTGRAFRRALVDRRGRSVTVCRSHPELSAEQWGSFC